jgi:nucleotide-binding universal stress UspA family protein
MNSDPLVGAMRDYLAAEQRARRCATDPESRYRAAERLEQAQRAVRQQISGVARRRRYACSFGRILVGIDDTPASLHALRYAATLAQSAGAVLGLVHVVRPVMQMTPELILAGEALDWSSLHHADDLLQRRRAMLPEAVSCETMTRYGKVAHEIVQAAHDWHADLIVLGHTPHKGLHRWTLRTTTDHLAATAPCPVLVVPDSAAHELPDEAHACQLEAR